MDRGKVLLQRLHNQLLHWVDYIRRCTYSKVMLEPPQVHTGEFTLSCSWRNKDGTEGNFNKMFSRQYVFGRTYSMGMSAWVIEKKACEYARGVVQDVLSARGVL